MPFLKKQYNNKVEKKPFCKVCQDAGKSESEYTSHYVRSLPDRTGKTTVVCPTLLATECRYCYNLGHTTKFCPVITSNKKAEEKALKQADIRQAQEKKPATKAKAPSSIFAAFADSDSEDEPVSKVSTKVSTKVKEEFPALSGAAAQTKPVAMSGWAAVAAKSAAQYESEKYEQELIAKSIKRMTPLTMKKVVVPQVQAAKKSWADWSDSEDEEEPVPVPVKRVLTAGELDWAAQDSESDEDW
jgi:hypothetical protein